jgi:hypothetical protein
MAEDELWRVLYAFPILFAVFQTVLYLTVFRCEPIDFSIRHGDDESAMTFLHQLYNLPASHSHEAKSVLFKSYIEKRR